MDRISPSTRALGKSANVRRYVKIDGRKVSVIIEDAFWNALKEIAHIRDTRRAALVSTIKSEHRHGSLSSALRLFVLDHYRALAERHAMKKAARRSLPARVRTAERKNASGAAARGH
jgi:predicted DNA-binding ribbon-helix-helix protein